MKKIFLLFSTLFTLLLNGQTTVYRPFPTNYGRWIYQYYDDFHIPTGIYTTYVLNGDTAISSVNYKKIYTNSSYSGAIRENSKIIYFVPDTSSTEFVLYNFNLSIGDTIFNPYGGASCSNDTVIVQSIDSVLCSDGYHKVFSLSSFAMWTEGIGSYNYLLKPAEDLCVSGNDWLECMISDSLFSTPTSSSCNVSVSVPEINYFDYDVTIFPNPSNGQFTIDFKTLDISEIILTDLLGRTIKKVSGSNAQTNFKIDKLASGTYILTLITKDKKQINKKIISSP